MVYVFCSTIIDENQNTSLREIQEIKCPALQMTLRTVANASFEGAGNPPTLLFF